MLDGSCMLNCALQQATLTDLLCTANRLALGRLDLKQKPVAVFGLGDSIGYGDYFCDAMEEIYNTFKATGARMVGHRPTQGYDHEGSKALLDDNTFCGLALDEDNQDDLSADRIKLWVAQISEEMKA
ncbi:MAG: flavodoxin [Trebouxia sp. A1-2]|nr:MAG: flavodoxin [Trebouxia sp. A1-2]